MSVQNARNMESGLATAVPLLNSVWKVLGSNTDQKPNSLIAVYRSFHQHNQTTAWIVTLLKLEHDHFLRPTFPLFIIG
jgi:hypothetical protein